ncbi:hypothetical protein [Pinibacter soli]|uniref:Beta-carotene 15,15'-monooxygenase n=1 Tax=Pinibacter soli TaxID=3044211 RepID=A0ABT6RHE9_9BACT|nr:hypothetical protein [Pinibacter soli]MDI3322001.1 hypothetical protein [Pinibacter soli]
MDFKNLPKGLFSLKKMESTENKKDFISSPNEAKPLSSSDNILSEDSLLHNETITVERFGFNSAKANNGSTIGLSICLNRNYLDFKKKVTDDIAKQADLKQPYRLKLHELNAENDGISRKIEKIKSQEIPNLKTKIERSRLDIAEIRSNPELLTGDKTGKASFYIGAIILVLLTVYLFVFYSSASYSSFFKEFKISEINIANTIFDARALSNAFNDGFTELILIITIPAVFLGLGYLIHKHSEKKSSKSYLIIAVLVIVTFIFDAIIAYEICEKIYDINKTNSFQNIPDYSLKLAFSSVNFWLIIFAGFMVYLIWGFVFGFTIEAHEKLDKVRVAIKTKEEQIREIDKTIDKLNGEINTLEEKESKNNGEIDKLNELVENTTIIPKEFEQYLYHFMQGWLHWMAANLKNQPQQKECEDVLKLFITANIKQIDYQNN